MEVYVLDEKFETLAPVIDEFESLIWTDRYQEAGDFELYLPMDTKYLPLFKRGRYLYMGKSQHIMVVTKIQITTEIESGPHIIVTGKSAEILLNRRIIWDQTRFDSKIDTAVKRMITESFINPKLTERKVDILRYKDTSDPAIDAITINKQHSGTVVYDAIVEQCLLHHLGFMIKLDNDEFVFSLYKGKDRSYDQLENPYVIFSPNFDNLKSSEYYESDEFERNVALVAGEDEGLGYGRRTVVIGDATGLDRRELYVDARDLQSDKEDGTLMPEDEYLELLRNRGKEKMLDYKLEVNFTGEAETEKSFKYGTDFFMGDIVQVEDGYGHSRKARVTEFIFSQNESGIKNYPTFQVVEEEEAGS